WGSNGVLGAVLWAGVSGLAVAIFAVIATRVTAFSYEDDSLGASLSMHSAGADMFFGTWLLIGLPLLLGHIAGGEKPSWWPLVAAGGRSRRRAPARADPRAGVRVADRCPDDGGRRARDARRGGGELRAAHDPVAAALGTVRPRTAGRDGDAGGAGAPDPQGRG